MDNLWKYTLQQTFKAHGELLESLSAPAVFFLCCPLTSSPHVCCHCAFVFVFVSPSSFPPPNSAHCHASLQKSQLGLISSWLKYPDPALAHHLAHRQFVCLPTRSRSVSLSTLPVSFFVPMPLTCNFFCHSA